MAELVPPPSRQPQLDPPQQTAAPLVAVDLPSPLASSSTSLPTPAPPTPASTATSTPAESPFDNPASEAARAAQAASRWNGLLRWARGARLGGQGGAPAGWDFATGMYHVPRDSPEWTAGVERAPVDPSAPTPALTLHTADKLSHLNPDAAMSDDEGGGAGLTESGRPKRRAVR
ncbi:hypothetical protein JCM8208_007398 [Rhodotorula glutinis]